MARFTKPIQTPDNWKELIPHPLSQLTEYGAGIDVEALAAHMQNNGYDEDERIILIWVEERKRFEILDGRHKHDGSIRAELVPTFSEFIGKDPMVYVIKKMLRQHLDESQRAMFGAKMANMKEGRPKTTSIEGVSGIKPITIAKAAQTLNVGHASIERARTVITNGTPELQKAVENGHISVSAAANLSKKTENEQKKVVKSLEPKRCKRCIEKNRPDLCPVCKDLNTPKDPTPLRYKAPKFDWLKFNKAIQILRRCLDDLATQGKPERRVPALRILDSFEKDVQSWEKATKE